MRTIVLVTALFCWVASARAEVAPAERFTLPNGMRVVLEPVPTATRAVVMVRYDVGSRDDPEGYRGLAHLTEHLSFQPGALTSVYESLGASEHNGMTGADGTIYFARLPPAALERALWIESTRMAFMLDGIGERELAHEQKVVINEWRQCVHNHDGNRIPAAVAAQLFPEGHPYRRVSDVPDDLNAVSLPVVQWFVQEHYVPARATLVVVGAFAAADVRAWAARYFGAVRALPSRLPRASPAPLGPLAKGCRVTIGGFRHVYESVRLTWSAPAGDSDDAAVLDVVAALLVGPRNARLTRRLAKVASSVTLEREELELAASLEIAVVSRFHTSVDGLLALIDEQLAALAAGRFGRAELSAARAYVARQKPPAPGTVARAFELADVHGQRDRERDRALHARVDHARVRAFAARWLDPRRRVVSVVDRSRLRDDVRCEEVSAVP